MKSYKNLSLIIFLFVLTYFIYTGLTTYPIEGDSLAYHIPIALHIFKGTILNPNTFTSSLHYYPGSSEAILALFIFLNIPLNLYNVLGWVLLFVLTLRLGMVFKLSKELSVIYATAVCLLPSVVRLIPNQTIDIWLAVFYLGSLILLEKPEIKLSYYAKLGFTLGMLIGTKYSGPLFATVLLLFYFKNFIKHINLLRLIIFIGIITLTGFSWYIRNFLFTLNPFYPASIFMFKGDTSFKLLNWQPWKTLIFVNNGSFMMIQALIAEFLIWMLALPWGVVILISRVFRRKIPLNIQKLILLGVINFIIYLFLPSWVVNLASDLRYTYSVFIPLILSILLLAKEFRKEDQISLIALIGSIAVIPQLDYYPKLFMLFICAMLIWMLSINIKVFNRLKHF